MTFAHNSKPPEAAPSPTSEEVMDTLTGSLTIDVKFWGKDGDRSVYVTQDRRFPVPCSIPLVEAGVQELLQFVLAAISLASTPPKSTAPSPDA